MRNFVALILLLLLTAPVMAQQVDKRTIGAATLEDVPPIDKDIGDAVARYQQSRSAEVADWLTDGSLLITTRFGNVTQLHRVAGPGMDRRQITFSTEPIAFGMAIPNTDRVLYSRDTGGDEWFQLYTVGADGRPVQLTEPGTRNENVLVSRDGSRIFWSRAVKGSDNYDILSANPADPATRTVIYQGTGVFGVDDISTDGKKLLLSRSVSNSEQKLFTLDIVSGDLNEVAKGTPAVLEGARYVRGGHAILVVSDRGSDVRRLVEIDVKSGRLTPVLPVSQWNIEKFDLSDDGRILAYATNIDGYSTVNVTDFSTGHALPQADLPKGVLTGLKLSPDGSSLAIGMASATTPGDVWNWNTADGKLQRWTLSEVGPLDRASLPEPALVRFKSFDGLSVPAFVYRPKSVAPGTKTPVLIMIHGGPESQARPGWSPLTASFVDTLGATVIVPNVRGSDGYGTRYLNMDNGEKRENSVKDIGALIDWIGAQPDLDANRVAVIGGSYGGYMALATMTFYSDRLVGGVDLFGISNWTTFLQNTETYRRANRRAEYGDERLPHMQEFFSRISPRTNVARITKPMLIEQGSNDPRVPQSESEQMVAAIRQRGVRVSYLLFFDEGHGWRKKQNQDLSLQVETAFLRGVLGVETPK
ncbi:S9 family peptidase [Xanthomonas hortorum]|uniref:S9 family peptidase n=1 Tax=Xanthomonas hortorum TaxID=56454 RepID=UPI001594DF15|nr:alpha/beta fold hydrolase [Xanthomonas hortorum]NHF65963.1 S9 family peptidase [Xanthomonas hortorum]